MVNSSIQPQELVSLFGGRMPHHVYYYHSDAGEVIGGVARWDTPGSKNIKLFRRALEEGQRKWEWGALPEPWPLYQLHRITEHPGASVVIVEGEKTAEAAQTLFPDWVVTTTMGGANAASKTDMSMLEGRHVLLASDNDPAGERYMARVIELCIGAGVASIKVLNPTLFPQWTVAEGTVIPRAEALPEGYDLADAFDEGWTYALIEKACGNAATVFQEWTEPVPTDRGLGTHSETAIGVNKADAILEGYQLTPEGVWYDGYG